MAKLCLGTAQFGGHDRSRYGLNAQRPPTRSEYTEMIRTAERSGLTFDTAAAYGVAEELLGSCLSPGVALTTKLLPFLSAHPDHRTRLVASEVLASRTRLRRRDDTSMGVLFHRINSVVQAAKARMRRFRSARKMIVATYLLLSKLDFQLPKALPSAIRAK